MIKRYRISELMETTRAYRGTSVCLSHDVDGLEDAIKDALSGWRYIRQNHGDLYGVGWDRVETKLRKALEGGVMSELDDFIEILEISLAKHGEQPLTNKWLLNLLKMSQRQAIEKDEFIRDMYWPLDD